MFEPVDYDIGGIGRTLIKVVGVGGDGGNAAAKIGRASCRERV